MPADFRTSSYESHLPQPLLRQFAPKLSGKPDRLAVQTAPGLFGFHILIKALRPS